MTQRHDRRMSSSIRPSDGRGPLTLPVKLVGRAGSTISALAVRPQIAARLLGVAVGGVVLAHGLIKIGWPISMGMRGMARGSRMLALSGDHPLLRRRNMAVLTVAVDIRRPVSEVWAFVTDLTNSPNWTRSGSELRQTSAGTMGVGATIESSRRILGRDIKSQSLRVTAYEPERAVSFVAKIPILRRAEVRLVFEPIAGGTRVIRTSEVEPGQVLRFLLPLLLPVLTSVQNTEMANIKRQLEAGP